MENISKSPIGKDNNVHIGHWLARPGMMAATVAAMFAAFFVGALFLGFEQMNAIRANLLRSDKTTVNLLASLLFEHEQATINILRSYASRLTFIRAVSSKNKAETLRELSDLKKNHEIDLTFVTDPQGVLWINHPFFIEAIGKDLSYRDWFRGVSAHWRPYVSEVFQLIVADKPLAVAIAVPVSDDQGKIVGILANSQRLEFLKNTIERVPFSKNTSVTIVDRKGSILYSNNYVFKNAPTPYPFKHMLEQEERELPKQKSDKRLEDFEDIHISAFPVGDTGWTAIIERKERDIDAEELRGLVGIGTVAFLLFTVTAGGLVYLRNFALFKETKKLLAAQKEVVEKERRYFSLLENVNMIAVGIDAEGEITFANPYFLKLTGYSLDEILGEDWFERFIPDEERQGVKEVFKSLQGDSPASHYENNILAKSGSKVTIFWNNTTLQGPQGQFSGTMSLGLDITEERETEKRLRESEQRYRELFENALEGIFISNPEGRFSAVNPAMAEMYGYDSPAEMIDSITDIAKQLYVNPENREEVISRIRKEGVLSNYQTQQFRKNGSIIWISFSARPVQDRSGKIILLEGMVVDITGQKKAEEEIRLINEELEHRVRDRTAQLEAANRELEAFAYSVSHDLRAPLRSIDGFSQALVEDYGEGIDDLGKDYLCRIRKSAQRMGLLIDDLLRLSQVSRYELNKELVDLSRICRELIEEYRKAASGRDVQIIIQDGMAAPGDPYLLRILLRNLIDNAWKFTRKTSEAEIEIGTSTQDGQTVYFIRDNGVGFDMAYVKKLFGAFQRLHKTEDFPGTGIGLATVQRIIARHGGRVWAEGEVNRGATFYFILPE